MKSLIVYYSFTGNTETAANALGEELRSKGEVSFRRLIPAKETKNFFMQCLQARLGIRPRLKNSLNFDISQIDMLCVGTPVWAFAPAPAINTYLDGLRGGQGKKAVVFTTYGSGAGVRGCLRSMKQRLSSKGIVNIKEFNIQQGLVKDRAFVKKTVLGLGI